MKVGLKPGEKGADVERLHRALTSAGLAIEPGEIERREFGPSTLDALHSLQSQRGLPACDEIDEAAFAVLIEIEQNITININEGAAPTTPPQQNPHRGVAHGKLVNEDGAPIAATRVSLFALHIRSETHLGDATTGKQGQYWISYHRPSALNLAVRAYDASGKLIAQSPTNFAAPATAEIDFTTAANGIVVEPSIYTTLEAEVVKQLAGVAFGELSENKDAHDIQFLASSIGASFDDVAYLFIGLKLGIQYWIRDATFFGIFFQGIPASLNAALASLPDSGIDDTFTAQVLTGVLAHSRDALSQALTAAVSSNVLPASYAAVQDAELNSLDALRTRSVGSAPYVRGKTSLNDLLGAGGISSVVQTAFTQAYAANNGQLGPTWKALRADKSLPAADLDALNTTLSLGELLTGNLPLVKDTLSRLSAKTLASVQDLALLDQSDWVARITSVDPDATSIPQVLPDDTPAQRIARFAKALASRFAGRYPTTAFAGGLSKSTTGAFAATKVELISFFTANPTLSIKSSSIDQFMATNKLSISGPALDDLKIAQRLFRISPHYASVETLKNAGYLSAQSVYFKGRTPFLAQMTPALGSASLAQMAYARAQMTYAASLMAFGRYNLSLNGISPAVFPSAAPPAAALDGLPDLQALFGSLDYFECADCQSVYSPAAYLVDLLQYLMGFPASGGGVTNARDALLQRRPDIQYIALDCNNTNTTLPYIDLVNELLESVIAPPSPSVTFIDTTGTSSERRALPQQISEQAYVQTAAVVFPLSLPFDLPFAETTAYIAALGTTRAAILALFAGNPVASSAAPAIAGANLGINPEMQAVINGTDTFQDWDRWGLASNQASIIDPGTYQPYPLSPANWVTALNYVPFLLNSAGLTIQQLYQLLEVVWVTESGVTLQPGTITSGGVSILNPAIGSMTFTGLTDAVLDRANRFLRLWTASGLQMWELDWALEAAIPGLDDSFLTFLANAITVKNQLNLPMQEALSFWLPLETRDVTNHLGDEDTVVPSTYSEVFLNAAVQASASAIFIPIQPIEITAASNTSPIAITTAEPHGYQSSFQVTIKGVAGNTAANGNFTITVTGPSTFTLKTTAGNGAWTSGGVSIVSSFGYPIIGPSTAPPTPQQNAVTAALGLSANDISAILTHSNAANALSLETLNVLLQYQRLSSSLSLDISDLILWIQLTAISPFRYRLPADTLEFCRRLAVLQGTGLAAVDLDYLIRNQSSTESSLAFTLTQATTVLQAVRDALAKLPASLTIPITGASNASPIIITTAAPSGLQSGGVVSISGALGNTAANGTFTIQVVSPTSFSLTGSTGNGAWTNGGIIDFTTTTIQTIFVAALVAATGTTANVVTPILLKTGMLPLAPATVALLVSETNGVDPTEFPALIQAFTLVAKGAALFTALKPTQTEFAFAVQNAATFNWLDPSALPLSPVSASPYAQVEALLRAFKLDQRQSALTPKLFDILGEWLANPVPATVTTAIGGPVITITEASNATPIAITTASPHYLTTGMQVSISGVTGNTAANGTFMITVTGASAFTLNSATGNAPWAGGGTVTQPYLAFALNGSVNDVFAIATQIGATAPVLTPSAVAGSLADMAMLAAIASALDVATRYGISGTTLVQLAAVPATAATASAAMGALQAQYSQSTWFGAIQPVEDTLRQNRRDAMVAYLLRPGPVTATSPLLTTDDIYNYYLIDPEMCPCALMTRLLQASLAIQQFMQQCFLNLSFGGVTVNLSNTELADEWSWRQQYRLWEANREVFLYPENYVLPELRTDASSFFTDLENDLRQSNCDADAAEAAMENYLRKLVTVGRLHVAAHYNETTAVGSNVLHVFAHTRGTPPQWFYRTRTSLTAGAGSWSAWESLNLDIASQQLVPVIWDQRLHLVWPIFKQISEKQSDQPVPSSGGGQRSPAAQKFWTVEIAMSELSAGQWQAKRTYAEKAFLYTDDSPLAFTFQATQDSSFNLNIKMFYSQIYNLGDTNPVESYYMAIGKLPMPDAPVSWMEAASLLPPVQDIDLSQEPTYALVQPGGLFAFLQLLATPTAYSFSGQDLVFGNYATANPLTPEPLYVLQATTPAGWTAPVSIELLNTITNPRIVIPQQEAYFDSADPFFVCDPSRTYLAEPQYYTLGSSPQELSSFTYAKQWTTDYLFQPFYHPYARTFLRELEIGGVDRLMCRTLQITPETVRNWPTFNFQTQYAPQPCVLQPYPSESTLDFAVGDSGPYSLYNWEIFYHVPMFVASLLLQNQQFQDALSWLEYIFNPTDSSGGPTPQRFWEMAPFNAMTSSDWISQQIQDLLTTLAAYTQQGINDSATATAIQNWMLDPFDPHAIASLRISAYGKATVMAFLNTLIAWGDWYYSQYTAEMVSQAEQLYILADMILGPQPQMLRLPNTSQNGPGAPTYASLQNIDPFSNVLVKVENVIVAPEPPLSIVQGTATTPSLPQFPGGGNTLLFCIPPNDQLLAYWGTVSQRLYNIRHCLNLQGVAQPLPLYAPPINPLALVEAAASGASYSSATPAAPIYRFATYFQKAVELTNDVRSYGALILSALEKQDAENLAVLRANQELDIQTRMLDVKTLQVTEAQDQITALQNQLAMVQIRYNFYSTVAFMNAWETAAIALQGAALIANGLAVILDMTSGVAHMLPTLQFGAAGFGGSPTITASFGGDNVASATSSWASVSRGVAGILSESGGIASTMGSYQRRQDDWTLQANLASAELTQVGSQITAATDRLNIANTELSIQNEQISNAQAISDFLTNKYTNAQLYNWMLSQLTTVYTQAYQLAFSLALQAQNAYQYELGSQDTFIQFGYWDSQHKGLTSGESLLFDLRRMEAQYIAENSRELELTKHISLAIASPMALVLLRETGSCQIALDEVLFERDHPGQYFRRLRSVALTIPCVTGPYTGVNATLWCAFRRRIPPTRPKAPRPAPSPITT
jgi:Tc toxin complex TcA C-terminal TcB-binding domain/Neuraminidase-like domain/Ubiquitin-activating enzyme E1 FCCH domain/Salmonella virulence plasmid 28.1kDa A protein